MAVFRLFEKLRHLNERSSKFESLNQEYKYLEEENGKMVALQISPKVESLYMDWVDKPKNYKDLYRILQLLRGFHLNNFPLKTLKLGWVAFHSVTFQFKCLDFQSYQYKKLVPVLSRSAIGYTKMSFPGMSLISENTWPPTRQPHFQGPLSNSSK